MALREPTLEMNYVWHFGQELRLHLIPKNAHHAMLKHGMDQGKPIWNTAIVRTDVAEKEENVFRVMCVRHPLDRLVSCWRYFTERDWLSDRGYMKGWGAKYKMSLEDFCKHYIENYERNIHTIPQVFYKGGQDINLLYPIEKLDLAWSALHDLFPEYTNPTIQRTHESGRGPWEDYVYPSLNRKLMKVLGPDLELYQEAQAR